MPTTAEPPITTTALSVPPSRLPTTPALPSVDEVQTALAKSDKPASPEQIAEVVWLLTTARDRALTTYDAVGKLINRDGTLISRVMRGVYPADLTPLCADIRRFRNDTTVADPDEEEFEPRLSVVTSIMPFCDLARQTAQIAMIWGENQSGKSRALRYYAEQRFDVVYVKLPAGGGVKKSMRVLAKACGISVYKNDDEIRDRILKRFKPSSLLIVDEFHQAVNGRTIKTVTVDRFREIHDDCGCGIVLCGTNVVNDMIVGEQFRKFLGQLDNRGALRLHIPKAPTKDDRELLFAAYGLPLPDAANAKTAKAICESNGIARLTDYFRIARRLAVNQGTKLTWAHFKLTHDTLTAWQSGIHAEGKA